MAIRVTQNTMYNSMVSGMQKNLGAYMESVQQGSTQKKINRPSDDPAGTYRVLTTRNDMVQTAQYQENVDTAKGWLNLADSVLSTNVTTAIQGLKTLAEQASTGTYTAAQRLIMADQARQYFGQLLNLSNTEFEDMQLFGGHKYDQSAFEMGLGVTSWDDNWNSAVMDGAIKVQGSTDRTVMVQFKDSGQLRAGMEYSWSNDAGNTWHTDFVGFGQNAAGEWEYQLKPTGSGVTMTIPVDSDYMEDFVKGLADDDDRKKLAWDGIGEAQGVWAKGEASYPKVMVPNPEFKPAKPYDVDPAVDGDVNGASYTVPDGEGGAKTINEYIPLTITPGQGVGADTRKLNPEFEKIGSDEDKDGKWKIHEENGENPFYLPENVDSDDEGNEAQRVYKFITSPGVDNTAEYGPKNGTFLYIRPTAVYMGDDNDPPLDVTLMGAGELQDPNIQKKSPDVENNPIQATGTFRTNVLVKIDGHLNPNNGQMENVDLSQQGIEFDWSYSTDGGATWITAKGKTPGEGKLRLPLPSGYIDYDLNGTDEKGNPVLLNDGELRAGMQANIHPSRADLNYEIMKDTYLAVNSVGKDVFGGYYEGKPAMADSDYNLFEVVGSFIGYLEGNNQEGCQRTLAALTKAEEQVLAEATRIGGMENRVEMAADVLSFQKIDQQERLSYTEDVDLTELLTRLTRQQLSYQTVLQSSSMIMKLSLLNYV